MDNAVHSFASQFGITEDDECEVVIQDNSQVGISNFLLVGKFLAHKNYNKEAFMSFFKNLWRPRAYVSIYSLKGDIILFTFQSDGDHTTILNRGPWNFKKMLFILAPVPIVESSFLDSSLWCFDHVDLGCQRYTGGVIDTAMALYGSWLQAKAKCAGRYNLRGCRFRLGEEDYFVDSDEEHPSENGPSPSPGVMSDPGLSVIDLETSLDCRNDVLILFHEPQDLAQEYERLIEENPRVDLAPLIPDLNLAI
ncbi:hypothetical protein ACFX13_000368 [Malus domestica]